MFHNQGRQATGGWGGGLGPQNIASNTHELKDQKKEGGETRELWADYSPCTNAL